MNLESFFRYTFMGGIATIVDWSIFYCSIHYLMIHYNIALLFAFCGGTITNYALNKLFTFKCESPFIFKQGVLHFFVSMIALVLSLGLLNIGIQTLHFDKMLSRIITTGIMLFVNYFFHKNITFNKKVLAHFK